MAPGLENYRAVPHEVKPFFFKIKRMYRRRPIFATVQHPGEENPSLDSEHNAADSSSLGSEDNATDSKKFIWLFRWHLVAAAVHGASFIALLVLYLVRKANDEDTLSSLLFSDTFSRKDGEVTVKNVGEYDLTIVLLFMPSATALFHVIQAVLCRVSKVYRSDAEKSVNWVRWAEYSYTASLMTWIVAQLSGVTNIFLLWLLAVVCNVALQCHGYLHERLFMDNLEAYKKWSNWAPMLNGSVIFLGQWTILLCYFIRTVKGADVPRFVWASFIGMLVTFSLFPVLQIWYAIRQKHKFLVTNWFHYEVAFIVLSLVSKLVLDWALFFGVISQ